MAERTAFEKRHIDESEKNDISGVLEQLNLPPAVVIFVREHKIFVRVSAALLVIAVVAWSFYGSYREKKIQNGASALAVAMETEGATRLDALAEVTKTFTGTDSALWARINMAHQLATHDKVLEANQSYQKIRDEISKKSPLYPLVVAGMAQSSERLGNYQVAIEQYEYLKNSTGYEDLGYSGLGRIQEIQGDDAKALEIYQQYLATMQSEQTSGEKTLIEEKIARIQASL